jgi:hypothetical protein
MIDLQADNNISFEQPFEQTIKQREKEIMLMFMQSIYVAIRSRFNNNACSTTSLINVYYFGYVLCMTGSKYVQHFYGHM